MRNKGRPRLTGAHTVDDRIGRPGWSPAHVDVGDAERFHANVTPVLCLHSLAWSTPLTRAGCRDRLADGHLYTNPTGTPLPASGFNA